MIDKEDMDLQEVQNIIIHDLAVHSLNYEADVAPTDDAEVTYIEGYQKGWWAAYYSAEKMWKEKADKYDQLCK